MILLFGFGKKKKEQAGTLKGKPITCLECKKTYSIKSFMKINGVCKCNHSYFSFLTDDVPDDELAKNKNISEGAKFILDADDMHIARIEGKKLMIFIKNKKL